MYTTSVGSQRETVLSSVDSGVCACRFSSIGTTWERFKDWVFRTLVVFYHRNHHQTIRCSIGLVFPSLLLLSVSSRYLILCVFHVLYGSQNLKSMVLFSGKFVVLGPFFTTVLDF